MPSATPVTTARTVSSAMDSFTRISRTHPSSGARNVTKVLGQGPYRCRYLVRGADRYPVTAVLEHRQVRAGEPLSVALRNVGVASAPDDPRWHFGDDPRDHRIHSVEKRRRDHLTEESKRAPLGLGVHRELASHSFE